MLVLNPNGASELYFDNSKKLETASDRVNVTGHMIATGTVKGAKISVDDSSGNGITIGSSDDLQIYHNGTNSYIDNNTGALVIDVEGNTQFETDNFYVLTNDNENAIRAFANGSVELYHDNSKKFETRADGVKITGGTDISMDGNGVGQLFMTGNGYTGGIALDADAMHIYQNSSSRDLVLGTDETERLRITGSGNVRIQNDSGRLQLGASQDLQIYHDGTESWIKDTGTGDLNILASDLQVKTADDSEFYITAVANNSVDLYFDGSKKFNTISNGVAINTTATTSTSSSSTASLVLDGDGNAYQIAFNDVGLNADRGFIMKAVSGQTAVVGAVFVDEGNDGCGSISFGDAGTTFATSSDYRIKENITNITNAITRLKQLKPCRFNFKKDSTKTVDGFLAHEAQTVVPEAVTGTKDEVDSNNKPVYQGIDQSKLVPLLVAAVQELTAKVEALEAA